MAEMRMSTGTLTYRRAATSEQAATCQRAAR